MVTRQDKQDRQGTNSGDDGNLVLAADEYRNRAGIDVGHVDEDPNQSNIDAGVEKLAVDGPDGGEPQITANEQRQRDELEKAREEREKAEAEYAKNQESSKTAADYESETAKDEPAPAKKSASKKS